MRSLRLLLVIALLPSTGVAQAQDRLFLQLNDGTVAGRSIEIGAIGRFGQPIGPAPADAFTYVFPTASLFRLTPEGIESAAGELVYSPAPGESIASWTSTPDATRLYVVTWRTGSFEAPVVRAIDVASRAEVAQVVGTSAIPSLTWMPGDRLVVGGPGQLTIAFDRDLRRLGVVLLGSYCQQWFVSAHTGRAYLLMAGGYSGNSLSATLAAFDTVAGTKVGEVNLGSVSGCYGTGVALWTAPGPPQRASASLLGRDVSVSWLPTDLAEGYAIEVGLAPGRTDLTFFVGASTKVVFAAVPPGAYFVRIRAGNVVGASRPSAEIRIVVP
jgi:hypothetical protein